MSIDGLAFNSLILVLLGNPTSNLMTLFLPLQHSKIFANVTFNSMLAQRPLRRSPSLSRWHEAPHGQFHLAGRIFPRTTYLSSGAVGAFLPRDLDDGHHTREVEGEKTVLASQPRFGAMGRIW